MELDAAAQLLLDAKLAKAWSGLHGGARTTLAAPRVAYTLRRAAGHR